MTPAQLAARWGTSTGTLKNWRSAGTGPDYIKIGHSVLYAVAAVTAFEDDCTIKAVA